MTLGSTQVIVSEVLYDSLGRQAITTVPVIKQDYPSSTINAGSLGFSSDFISSRDPQQESSTWVGGGALAGSITSWVNQTSFCLEGDANYAYQGVYYETDPTSRTLQSSKPGITFQKSPSFSDPGYSESYYANYFPQEIYSVLYSSPIQIPNVDGQDTAFTSPNSFPYMPMSAQQTDLGNNGLVTQASWADNAGRLQGKVTVDANNTFILQSLSYQTGAALSSGVDSKSTSQCAIMGQLQTYLPNSFDSSVTDQTNFYVLKQINALGQVVQTYSPDQNNTLYYTDLYGRLRYSQTAGQLLAGMIQYYLYDNLNRIIEVGLYPGTWNVDTSNIDSFQQNTLTLITPQPDQAQVQKSITYDGLPTLPFDPNAQGKIAQVVTYPSAENTSSPACVAEVYTYDTWGRMISVTKAIVNTEEDSPFTEGNFTTQYIYNGVSRVLEITSTSNNNVFDVNYSYNLQGLVNQISYSPSGSEVYPLASYTYNEQGQIAAEVLFDANASTSMVTTSYTYGNSLHQLTNISTVVSPLNAPQDITPLFGEKICYTDDESGDNTKGIYQDGNIQLTAYAYGMNAESNYQLQYAYDAFGRLYCAGATPGWVGAWAGFGSTNPYGNFDSNGNYLLDMTYDNTGTNQVTGASALSQRTPYTTATFNYTKGNSGLTSSISYSSTNEEYLPYTMTITSDLITQRPLQATLTNQEQTLSIDTFLYDRKGERIQKVLSSNNVTSITTYARGKGAQVLAEYDGNNNPQAYYIYGPLGLVSLYDPTTQQNSFILKDHLGSSRVVFNAATNEVTSYYGYDSFGNPFLNKSTQDNAIVLRYLYTGQEWDQELRLYNYHARQYDPLYTKRFLSPDPTHQFPSPYTYCANNPVNATDPTGKVIYVAINKLTKMNDAVMWINIAYALEELESNNGDTTIYTHDEFLKLTSTTSEIANDRLYTIGHGFAPTDKAQGYITADKRKFSYVEYWGPWADKMKAPIEALGFKEVKMVQCYGIQGAEKLSAAVPEISVQAFNNLSFSHPFSPTFSELNGFSPNQDAIQNLLKTPEIESMLTDSLKRLETGSITPKEIAQQIGLRQDIRDAYSEFKNRFINTVPNDFNETPYIYKGGNLISGPKKM